MSILVVLLTAVGFVAARSGPEQEPVSAGADEIAETATPLPTPVPLATGTPLPTPVPLMEQGSVVDTAVTWWGAWLPDEVTDALNEIAASRSRSSTTTSRDDQRAPATVPASPSPSPEPAADDPVLEVPSVTAVPLPLPTPLPILAPLPTPILPLSTPTLPQLLP